MIFVSYSWINDKPNVKVLEFVAYLRQNGYEATCDVMFIQEQTSISFPKMIAQKLNEADKVIIVLSEEYKTKADSFYGGVGKEYQYIITDIENSISKYILVSFSSNFEQVVPSFLSGREIIYITNRNSYKKLFYKLDNIPQYKFPDVNRKKNILYTYNLETKKDTNVPKVKNFNKPAIELKSIKLYSTGGHKKYTDTIYKFKNHNFGFKILIKNNTTYFKSVHIDGCIYNHEGITITYWKNKVFKIPPNSLSKYYLYVYHNQFIHFKEGKYKAQFWINNEKTKKEYFTVL